MLLLVIQQIISFLWQPDPLMDSLESVVGDHETFDGRLEAAATDAEVIMTVEVILNTKKVIKIDLLY